MAQEKLNGSVLSDQFLTGVLNHYIIDASGGTANVASVGYTYDSGTEINTANDGEQLLMAVSTLVNPVIWEISDVDTVYFAAEVDGVTAESIEAVLQADATFANVTVTAGTYTVTAV